MSQVVVVIGGGDLSPRAVAHVADGAVIIAADSGLDHARTADLVPTVLIGDLDSISAAGHMWAYAHNLEIIEHPADKDATDTALALERAVAEGDELVVLGGAGDRLDHTLSTLLALGGPVTAGFHTVTAYLGDTVVHVLHPGQSVEVQRPPGTTFSLLALQGPCTGVVVRDARWPLDGVVLQPTSTLGVSNEVIDQPVRIAVADGVLTVVVP